MILQCSPRERGPYSHAWQNNSALVRRSKVTPDALRASSYLKHDTNNVVHKNLPTASPESDYLTHTCTISSQFLSLYLSLSEGLISLNASLNSSIGLSYLFSLKHSSGQLFKFLLELSKHFFFLHLPRILPLKMTLSCVFVCDKGCLCWKGIRKTQQLWYRKMQLCSHHDYY